MKTAATGMIASKSEIAVLTMYMSLKVYLGSAVMPATVAMTRETQERMKEDREFLYMGLFQ